jgi:hypothetical protein
VLVQQGKSHQADASWAHEIEDEQMIRVNLMSVMGGLAIPSPNFALPYAGAVEKERVLFSQFQREWAMRVADLEVKRDMVRSLRSIATEILRGKNPDHEFLNGLGDRDLQPEAIRRLSPEVRSEVARRYESEWAAKGMFHAGALKQMGIISAATVYNYANSTLNAMTRSIYGDIKQPDIIGLIPLAYDDPELLHQEQVGQQRLGKEGIDYRGMFGSKDTEAGGNGNSGKN